MKLLKLVSCFVLFFASKSIQALAQIPCKFDLVFRSESVEPHSIAFWNAKQEVHFQEIPYADSIRLEFNAYTDDIYTVFYLGPDKNYQKQIWLEAGNIKLYFSIQNENLSIDTAIGTELYYQTMAFNDSVTLTKQNETRLLGFLTAAFDQHQKSPFSTHIAGLLLSNFQNNKAEMKKLQTTMEMQSEVVKSSFLYPSFYKRIRSSTEVEKIDFKKIRFLNEKGKKVSVKRKKEPYLVLDFWFVNCPPCIQQHKAMKNDFEEGQWHEDIRWVGVSTDKKIEKWQAYLSKSVLPWENLLEPAESNLNLSRRLNLFAYPTYIVLNEKNNLVATFNAYDQVKKFLKSKNIDN